MKKKEYISIVVSENGEVKFWIEPIISHATYFGLNKHEFESNSKTSGEA